MSSKPLITDLITFRQEVVEGELVVNFPMFPRGMSYPLIEASGLGQPKRVRFLDEYEEIFDDFEGNLRLSTWYSKKEYKNFHETMISDVKTMRSVSTSSDGTCDGNDNIIFTGIEHLASQGMLRCQAKYRAAHKEAVLEEYSRQDALGVVDCKKLRKASKSYSEIGKIKALVLAGNKAAFTRRQNI